MRNRTIPLALCGLALLGACTDPSQLDPNTNHTRNGALVGGAFGALAGLATSGGEAKDAIIGGVAGAAAGGIIGNMMDRQAAELRQSIANENVIINQVGGNLVVTMPQDILFAVDSTSISEPARQDLGTLAASLNKYPDTRVEVIGHTDNTGAASYNEHLSVRRAQTVANVLVANGVAPARVSATGRGEAAPVATNLTEEGKAQNRRVDIIIRPTTL
ncbi:OmpA family protein [Tropicimonas sp.]|uniref:OmpA family protein n=1 Tax=Tropicimonas sp. TaxID=2067044 RepID=UPI003A836068